MSSPKVFVHVAEKTFNTLTVNGIQCGVSYWKSKNAVILSLDVCRMESGKGMGGGISITLAPFTAPSSNQVLEVGQPHVRDWPPANWLWRVSLHVLDDIEERTGWGWCEVGDFAEKHGLTIEEKK